MGQSVYRNESGSLDSSIGIHCRILVVYDVTCYTLLRGASVTGGGFIGFTWRCCKLLLETGNLSIFLTDGLIQGRLPALGWNSWNAYYCNVSEQKILDAANQILYKLAYKPPLCGLCETNAPSQEGAYSKGGLIYQIYERQISKQYSTNQTRKCANTSVLNFPSTVFPVKLLLY